MSSHLEKDAVWESTIRGLLYKQLFVYPPDLPSTVRFEGKSAIVTGANGGLGLESSRQLLERGLSHLIVTVRTQEKGDIAARQLMDEFPGARVDVSLLDLADYDSIIAFVDRCRGLERLDYAILNAGMQRPNFKRNDRTGHEVILQTNYISTTLLATLLAPVMKDQRVDRTATPPVLSIVGSDTMYMSKLKTTGSVFPVMNDEVRFQGFQQYMDSKLLLMMFTVRLAEQYDPKDIVINVSNPGLTYGTNLGGDDHKSGLAPLIIKPIVRALGRSLAVGASVYVHALVLNGEESHGSFVSDWQVKP
ncbi:hypothetical protein BDV25DRAFT_147573 [Aspergillus avenaceus]|uniref:NAD(P)-binding protein n=1 Tax=Aspergillus avenaceus TaxID=36643 RepID=A0A5N6U7L2_ASPAV|nr:hypothetical protein BDV25DRAFT_147573 [Aspergillus avenaceus]